MIAPAPSVSIVIPVYNGERFIGETIESVLSQTYTNYELLIVDDCSSDSSCEIVNRYILGDNRIRLLKAETNFGGPAGPRNMGMGVARGEYIAFVDADDVWKPDKLQKQVDFLTLHPEMDMVFCKAEIIDENGNVSTVRKQVLYTFLSKMISPKELILYVNYINMNTLMIRRSLSNRFKEDKRVAAIEDWMFHILNLSGGYNGAMMDEPLIYYRVHTASISNRTTDKSYRKIFYMLAILFMDDHISLRQFVFASLLNGLKLLRRRWMIFRSAS